jgi:DNA-binding MarR family transcriptional regulator
MKRMKGIYLTEQGKKEIEAEIAELENSIEDIKYVLFDSSEETADKFPNGLIIQPKK